jgi:tRNA-Thr(GGU) m(6)t(6)A37 methyltransferase TsaA
MDIHFTPIGYIHTTSLSKYEFPRQATKPSSTSTYIELASQHNFEQAIDDLQGFSHIWIIAYFEGNEFQKPKILTPLSREKKGVFATRSPHRPNPIGISVVPILAIEGRKIFIGANDLLDGTAILDIKPYLPHADSFPNASIGWMEGLIEPKNSICILEDCRNTWEIFELVSNENQQYALELLQKDPFPHPYRRIREIDESTYVLSVKLWRIVYKVCENVVTILSVDTASEYDIDQAKCQGYPTKYFLEIEKFQQMVYDSLHKK